MEDYSEQIALLETAAKHEELCGLSLPSSPSSHEPLFRSADSLIAYAGVLRAAMGDKLAQRWEGYDWQTPGRVERALEVAASL
jgi:hypothetical protein